MIGIYLSPGNSSARYSHQYWAPVVANHFPPTSPFIQSQNLGYSLLPQGVQFSPPPRAPALSQSPVARQRSGGAGGDYTLLPQTPKLERKRSRKGTREVSWFHSLTSLRWLHYGDTIEDQVPPMARGKCSSYF